MSIQNQILPLIPSDKLGDFAENPDGHSGLNYAYYGGILGGSEIPGGFITLTPSSSNYVELQLNGVVTHNTSAFTLGKIPLALVTTDAGSILTATNRRSWVISIVGGGSGGYSGYEHTQLTASNSWSVVHGLNRFPSVTVIDGGNTKVEAEVQYVDSNNVTIAFSNPESGKAYLI